ncbi:MAG: cell division protein FtsL [Treponema sp.]|nr:cell division protein FtsL [Treponema sp.]
MKKYYVFFFLMVLTIPPLLWVNAWQANECGEIRNEIKKIEKSQENCVEENKTVAADIARLLAVDKLENDAQKKLGLVKIRPEDVTLIIMGGRGRGF